MVSPPLETEIKSEEAGILLNPKQENGLNTVVKQENEIKSEVKSEGPGILLKPRQEILAKSAAQIVHEQREK